MKRALCILLILCLALAAAAQKRRAVAKPAPKPEPPRWFQDPLPGITEEERTRFNRGRDVFDRFQKLEDGLGPLFNARACSECHILPTVGGGGYFGTAMFGTTTNGAFDPMTQQGGPELQSFALGTREKSPHIFTPEKVPESATIRVQRGTPPLFGLGLVDATPTRRSSPSRRNRPRATTARPAASPWSTTSAPARRRWGNSARRRTCRRSISSADTPTAMSSA